MDEFSFCPPSPSHRGNTAFTKCPQYRASCSDILTLGSTQWWKRRSRSTSWPSHLLEAASAMQAAASFALTLHRSLSSLSSLLRSTPSRLSAARSSLCLCVTSSSCSMFALSSSFFLNRCSSRWLPLFPPILFSSVSRKSLSSLREDASLSVLPSALSTCWTLWSTCWLASSYLSFGKNRSESSSDQNVAYRSRSKPLGSLTARLTTPSRSCHEPRGPSLPSAWASSWPSSLRASAWDHSSSARIRGRWQWKTYSGSKPWREDMSSTEGRSLAYAARSLADVSSRSPLTKAEYCKKELWHLSIRTPSSLRGGLSRENMSALCCCAVITRSGTPRSIPSLAPSPSPAASDSDSLSLSARLAKRICCVLSPLSRPLTLSMFPPASISTWLSEMSSTCITPSVSFSSLRSTTRSTVWSHLSWFSTYWAMALVSTSFGNFLATRPTRAARASTQSATFVPSSLNFSLPPLASLVSTT